MNRRSFFTKAVGALACVPGLGWLKPIETESKWSKYAFVYDPSNNADTCLYTIFNNIPILCRNGIPVDMEAFGRAMDIPDLELVVGVPPIEQDRGK